jgi:hypothetical protein
MAKFVCLSVMLCADNCRRRDLTSVANLQMVAKLGAEFESKVMREANSPKFSFLLQTDMYHQYYQHKIGEFKGGDKVPEPTPEQMAESLAKREPAYEVRETCVYEIEN